MASKNQILSVGNFEKINLTINTLKQLVLPNSKMTLVKVNIEFVYKINIKLTTLWHVQFISDKAYTEIGRKF